MTRLLLVVAFATASGLIAADFSGRWAGTAVTADGRTGRIYLTVSQQGPAISGILINVEPKALPLGDAIVRNDELSFRVSESGGQSTLYALTMIVSGNPSLDRQVELRGALLPQLDSPFSPSTR